MSTNFSTSASTNTSTDTPKVALVTGAAKRLGAKIAEALHTEGYNIALHYNRSASLAKTLADKLNNIRPNSCLTFQANLLDQQQIRTLAANTLNAWGKLNLLVNNASTYYPTPIENASPAQWDDLIGSNTKSPFFLSQALTPALKATKGNIINLVDIYAEQPLKEHAIYCIAKAGNAMLVKSLAKELAPDIRVNGVAPGNILWPDEENPPSSEEQKIILNNIPLQKQGSYTDITNTVLYLAENAPYVTGQVIAIDGGLSVA